MKNNPLPRLDKDSEIYKSLLSFCRLSHGDVWTDPVSGHKVGCLDASKSSDVKKIIGDTKAALAVHDPPYNLIAFEEQSVQEFISWSKLWVQNTIDYLAENASLYIWLGADQKERFSAVAGFHDYDAFVRTSSYAQLHYHAQPAGLWDAKELDGRASGIALLHQRKSGIQY